MDFIFDISIPFEKRLNKVLHLQLEKNEVYQKFYSFFDPKNEQLQTSDTVPLLPIRVFKDVPLIVKGKKPQLIFQSSGTDTMRRSTHLIAEPSVYIKAIESEFYKHFPKQDYSLLAYTPGYNENPESSLIWMINHLIKNDQSGLSRFLTLDEPLKETDYKEIVDSGKSVILFGAAFGLLDLIDKNSVELPEHSAVIETGGMKTYRREITKHELQKRLSVGFRIPFASIHSEYGMCELLSQCYALGSEWFQPPGWVHISIRDSENPAKLCQPGVEGKIGIIDLANVYSCPFILTEDRGVMDSEGRFRVLGRWNNQDLRGCNFLIDRD